MKNYNLNTQRKNMKSSNKITIFKNNSSPNKKLKKCNSNITVSFNKENVNLDKRYIAEANHEYGLSINSNKIINKKKKYTNNFNKI